MNEMPGAHLSTGADIALLLARATRIIDISLELDAANFRMRTYAGFKKDTAGDLESGAGAPLEPGDRLLLRSGINESYDGSAAVPVWC